MRPGLLAEYCQLRTRQLLAEFGWTSKDLREYPEMLNVLASVHGLEVVEVDQVVNGAALDLAAATIRVDRGRSGLERAFAVAREYAHAKLHRAEMARGIALTQEHVLEATVFAVTLLGRLEAE